MTEIPESVPLRVLVVDDCRDTTTSMAMLLKLWGHEARTANDGNTALKTAEAFRPHVVLLDVALGVPPDGFELAKQLRLVSALEKVFIICVSGYGADSDRKRSQEAGCDFHLIKPVDCENLAAILKSIKVRVSSEKAGPLVQR